MAEAATSERLEIPAKDGFPLAAEWRGGKNPERLLLIAPATGVKQTYYRFFADYFAARGWSVLTWDWRGIGASRPASLKGFQGGMDDWAKKDLPGVLEWAEREHRGAKRAALGHSFGGQSPGFAGKDHGLEALVMIGSQNGYWGHWPAPRKYSLATFWHLVVPAITHTIGHFPGRILGSEDLPKEVALDWARWCRTQEYFGQTRHHEFAAPILAYCISDDTYAPRKSVEALLAKFGSPSKELRLIEPRDAGLKALGHFGYFRPQVEQLWQEPASWLEAQIG